MEVLAKSENSKSVNENRLVVQKGRLELMDTLKEEVLAHLKKELQDKTKYKKLIKELIVQVRVPKANNKGFDQAVGNRGQVEMQG